MRRMILESGSLAIVALLSFLFRPAAFFVRMWRANECRRFTLPVAVILKRLAAPLWVFSFMCFFCRFFFCFTAPAGCRLRGKDCD